MKQFASVAGRLEPASRSVPLCVAIAIAKILKIFGLFSLLDQLAETSVFQTTWLVLALTAASFLVIQRPFHNYAPLARPQIARVAMLGLTTALQTFLFFAAVLLCGPLRAVLLADYGHVALIGLAGLLLSVESAPARKVRGAILSLSALLLLLMWDEPAGGHVIVHEETSGAHQDYHTVRHNKYFAWLMVSDHTVGMIVALIATCVGAARARLTRMLTDPLGGARRTQALGSIAAAAVLTPFALLNGLIGDAPLLPWSSMPTLIFIALIVFIIDFYVDRAAAAAVEPGFAHALSMAALFAGAVVLEQSRDVPFAIVPAVAFFLMLFGTKQLVQRVGAASTPIGYAPDGLPLYSSTPQTSPTFLSQVRSLLRAILDNRDTKQIFMFLSINAMFMVVEFTYGIWSNSLGLISDAFHMFFDCSALMVGLYAAVMAKWKPTRVFSFGYSRVEVLSGFANGIFLVIISLSVFSKAITRLYAPPHIHTDRLVLVSAGGLIVNMIGIFAFSHAHQASHGGGACTHGHSHDAPSTKKNQSLLQRILAPVNANMQGVFLHILADTLGSVGVLISSTLVQQFGWLIVDPLCSVFIAVLIFVSVIPLLRQSATVLLLGLPTTSMSALLPAFAQIRQLEGVLGYHDPKVWLHTASSMMGTVHIVVGPGVNEQKILSQATSILQGAGLRQVAIQIESEAVAAKRLAREGLDRSSLSSLFSFGLDHVRAV
eukprot:m.52408 g.52408  ORF g.52408 m.52408 type:complete len:716 (-) comp11770_c0_seq4:347-2494(-)